MIANRIVKWMAQDKAQWEASVMLINLTDLGFRDAYHDFEETCCLHRQA
jgi:hypothetical protein